jgi:hypothetical protein
MCGAFKHAESLKGNTPATIRVENVLRYAELASVE